MTRWVIDELSLAGAEHRDATFVAGYDRKQGHPDPATDIAAFEAHGVGRDSTVIDFGAGTGQFALEAARHFKSVIAIDISPEMIGTVRSRAAEAGLRNVECAQSGFLTYEHAGSPVDGVFTRNALHHLPDFFKGVALARMAELLRPGGVLRLRDIMFDFDPADADASLAEWFEGASTDPAAGYTADDFAQHVRDEFSTYRTLMEELLAMAGFEVVDVSYARRVYGAYTCRRR